MTIRYKDCVKSFKLQQFVFHVMSADAHTNHKKTISNQAIRDGASRTARKTLLEELQWEVNKLKNRENQESKENAHENQEKSIPNQRNSEKQ